MLGAKCPRPGYGGAGILTSRQYTLGRLQGSAGKRNASSRNSRMQTAWVRAPTASASSALLEQSSVATSGVSLDQGRDRTWRCRLEIRTPSGDPQPAPAERCVAMSASASRLPHGPPETALCDRPRATVAVADP